MDVRTAAPFFFRTNSQRDHIQRSRVDRALKRSRKFGVESLEPRVLLNADAVVVGFQNALATGMTSVSNELYALIHTPNVVDAFDSVVPGILETQGTGSDAVESSPTVEQLLDSPVDVDAGTKKDGFSYTGSGTLRDRFDYILNVVPLIASGDSADERALDAMDYLMADGSLGQDGNVT